MNIYLLHFKGKLIATSFLLWLYMKASSSAEIADICVHKLYFMGFFLHRSSYKR